MPPTPPLGQPAPENSAAAIRCLTEQGYDATTAGDLAGAVGMSRSTFFRRYGSKDDVVFADHDHALAQLESFLANTTLPRDESLVNGASDVLRLLTRNPEAARLRFELLRDTPALRDRELIITHRYERVFADYLRNQIPAEFAAWVPSSLAASLVAVHNATLRDWLRGRTVEASRILERDLRQLVSLYRPWLFPDSDETHRRVVVAVYDSTASPESVLTSISASLS